MTDFGKRLKELRKASGKSQVELANALGITVKSIQRYEKGGRADTAVLEQLAKYFNVSTAYLLGTKGYTEIQKEREEKLKGGDELYKNYVRCINDYEIDEDAEYYWITLEDNLVGGQTEWVRWVDLKCTIEIRRLRPVKPRACIEACTELYGKPMVINSELNAATFRVYGGHAFVRKDIGEKYLPEFFKNYIVKNGKIYC